MFRVTGGQFLGMTLAAPRGLRASGSKVRQAIYNILAGVVQGARVLDGFAGSGSLGFEALSRGAAFVAFIDADTDAVMSIRDNLEQLSAEVSRPAWRIVHMEIESGIRYLAKSEPPFDLALLDPPYHTEDGKKALNALGQSAILVPAGLVGIEHHQRTHLPAVVGPLQQFKQHRYGDTVLSFYRVASTA